MVRRRQLHSPKARGGLYSKEKVTSDFKDMLWEISKFNDSEFEYENESTWTRSSEIIARAMVLDLNSLAGDRKFRDSERMAR